jgi:hypothetical protein
LVLLVEVVAAFRHGKGDHARIGRRPDLAQRREFGIPWHDGIDGLDARVRAMAGGVDGLQRVSAVLGSEVMQQRAGIVADIGKRQAPRCVAGLAKAMQIPRLVRAMEGAGTQVQPGGGGRGRHDRVQRWAV